MGVETSQKIAKINYHLSLNPHLIMTAKICCILILSFSFLNVSSEKNDCFFEGKTWSTEGQSEIFFDVTWNQCINLFVQNNKTKGFTYYRSNPERLSKVCILFESLKEKHECTTCIS